MKAPMWLAASVSLIAPLAAHTQQPDTTKKDTTTAPVTISGSVSTGYIYGNHPLDDTILVGRAYDRYQNNFSFNVFNFTVDRAAPIDRVAAGFHGEAWLGQNAAVVQSNGLNIGVDATIWQAYAVLNLPLSGAGRYVQVKAGKLATLLGVEVGEDVLNPNFGIGYQDIFLEPFTETGVEVDGKLSSRWDAELRISNGWDQVLDLNKSKTITARVGLTPDDKTLIALSGYLGPEQPNDNADNRGGVNLVASRKLTSAAALQLQLDYGAEAHAATDGGQATWAAAGAWFTYDVASKATLAIRADYMNDEDGARTSGVLGFPKNNGMKVGSVTATMNVKYWDRALVRPEIRFDRATLPVFDAHKDQLSIGAALSYIY